MYNYQELEIECEQYLNQQEYTSYFNKLREVIKTTENYTEFIQPIIIIINKENQYQLSLEKTLEVEYKELFIALQDRFVFLGDNLNTQNKPSRDMFYLFKISSNITGIPSNSIIESNIQELTTEYEKMSFEGEDQLFIHDILFVLEILNGKEKALDNYLKRTFTLHVQHIEQGYSEFVQKLLVYFDVSMETIIDIFEKLLTPKYYFNLLPWQRRSIFNWILHAISQLKTYHNNTLWYKIYTQLIELLHMHIKNDHIDEVMYLNFFILHKMGNLFQTQKEMKEFNKKINIPVSKYYKKWGEDNYLLGCKKEVSKTEKIKIAFIETRLVKNSPYFLLMGLLNTLMKEEEFTQRYEVIVYSANYLEKSEDDISCIEEIESLGIKVINPNGYIFKKDGFYHSHFEKALNLRNDIIKNKVDVMVTYNDYDIFNFLFSTRSAPKQIYWSHINFQYDIKGIDKKISHISRAKTLDKNYTTFQVASLNKYIVPETIEHEQVQQIRDRFSKETIILGSIGRLIKIDSEEFLSTIAKVLLENENMVFLACGSGSMEGIKKKLKALNVKERFYFEGYVDPHIHGYAIDMFCNPFPQGGGTVASEYELKENTGALVKINTLKDVLFCPTDRLKSFLVEMDNSFLFQKHFKEFYEITDDNIDFSDIDKLDKLRKEFILNRFKIEFEDRFCDDNKDGYYCRLNLFAANPSLRDYYSEKRRLERLTEYDNSTFPIDIESIF